MFDQYLSFRSLEHKLFSLGASDSYAAYSHPDNAPNVEQTLEEIARGLFAVLATLGVVPHIRCAPGGPSEMLARRLSKKIKDEVKGDVAQSVFAKNGRRARGVGRARSAAPPRPLLLLLDREFDLLTPLRHPSTYQA